MKEEPGREGDGLTPSETAPPRGRSLQSRTRRGTLVSFGGQAANQVLRLGSNLVLTRLLAPDAFGLMAIVNLVMMGLHQITHIGIQPALVRHARGDEPVFLDTAFSMQALRGTMLCGVAALLALPAARFYGEPALGPLLAVASLGALINGLFSTKLFSAIRRLAVTGPTLIDLAGQATALVATVAYAWWRRDVWALVLGAMTGSLVRLVLTHVALPGPRNHFRWDREVAREIVTFGRWILVSTLFAFLALRFDVALLGKLLPMSALGIYSVAIILPGIVRDVSGQVMQVVLMPALSETHRQGEGALTRSFARAREATLPLGVVAVVGAALAAPAFFFVLYDPRYHDAGGIAQLSMIALWFGYLHETSGRALLVVGDSRTWAFASVVKAIATAAGCAIGFWLHGVTGLLLGLGVAALCGYAVVAYALAELEMPVLATDLRYTALAAAIGATGALLPRWIAADGDPRSVALLTAALGALLLAPFAWIALRRARS
jgi:O-antigen/teichoic acid export membrane protein